MEAFNRMISTKKESLRPRSKKRAKQETLYRKLRDQFLAENPVCQVENCQAPSSEAHHKKGRTGELLTDVRYFLAVCHHHHYQIEMMPMWARQLGYSISRLSKL